MARPPSGFTLFELMLVMAIILVAAALTIPAIDAMMGDGRVKAARDVVRGKWADARGRAMREGRPYKFSIIENTGKYRVEPEDATQPSDGGDDSDVTYQDEGELPPQVLFTKDPNSVGMASGAGSDYEVLVVYLPNGTARADVQVLFGKEGGRPIGLQLRGLTGAVTMIDQPQNNGP
jgi:prepilin-type N-terminal cleavage/methylation domain-containing protein